jgi:hypothetical protein
VSSCYREEASRAASSGRMTASSIAVSREVYSDLHGAMPPKRKSASGNAGPSGAIKRVRDPSKQVPRNHHKYHDWVQFLSKTDELAHRFISEARSAKDAANYLIRHFDATGRTLLESIGDYSYADIIPESPFAEEFAKKYQQSELVFGLRGGGPRGCSRRPGGFMASRKQRTTECRAALLHLRFLFATGSLGSFRIEL